jgi:hypothetical protein
MYRRVALSLGVIGACAWCLVLVNQADSAEQPSSQAPQQYEIVAPVASMMYAQAYHFDQIKELAINEGAENRFPNLRHEAMILAELCNINGYRATEEDYRGWARSAKENCLKVAEAAAKQDVSNIREFIKNIQNACRDCHDKYE